MAERLQTVQKTLEIARVLAAAGELSLAEVSQRVGLSKTVVHRVLTTLRDAGWAEQVPDTRKYRLGLRTWELGVRALEHVPLYQVGLPVLERFAAEIGEHVALSVYDDGEMLFVVRISIVAGGQVSVPLASRAPAHTTSGGKVALAYLRDAERRALEGGLAAMTPNTVIDPAALRAELAEIRLRGYAINREGRAVGSCGLAVPVFDRTGGYAASVHVVCAAARFDQQWIERVAPLTLDCGASLSRALGYRGQPEPAAVLG